MSNQTFVRLARIDASAKDVFQWHTRDGALERLTPPWVHADVVQRAGGIRDGDRLTLRLRKGPFTFRWVVEHVDYEDDRQFRDVQVKGPFAYWVHTHRFEPDGIACYVQDKIEYRLPMGPLGKMFGENRVREELERLFVYRHRILAHDIAVHRAYSGVRPQRVLVTGSSGLIGSTLVPFLQTGGHEVVRMVRGAASTPGTISWDPVEGRIDRESLEGFDVVIHLAGENLMGMRWTDEKKRRIRDSRVNGTGLLAETLASLERPPRVFLAASAIGYYGHRGSEILDEESKPGSGFLPEVCEGWEAATEAAIDKGIRVVNLRFGMVLTPTGGALAKMLPAFKMGVGGPIGTGWQFISWITMDDAIEAIYHSMLTETLQGPINVVSPYVATNRDFAKTLGLVLGAPAAIKVPDWAVKLALGELAQDVLLTSVRAEPRKLTDTGFIFHFPDLESALRHVLGRT